MDMCIMPGPLQGRLTAPPSKSAAHRAVICAALARGRSRLGPIFPSDDILATMDAAGALGAVVSLAGQTMIVEGISDPPASARVNCGESGSTLRFLVPIAAAMGVKTLFTGRGKLPQRPLTPLTDALKGFNCRYLTGSEEILQTSGKLEAGRYTLPGDVSSQYISGLLFALPLLGKGSELRLSSPLQSKGYVDMTLQSLARSGIVIHPVEDGWDIPGGQRYSPYDHRVEGDYSNAAFWLCAGALSQPVTITGLTGDSLQGDMGVLDILERFGADVQRGETVRVGPAELYGIQIDATQIPDLVPILSVVAACAQGESVIYGAGRLRIKESDRLQSVTAGLKGLGADIREFPDRLVIQGTGALRGGKVDSFSDHRIAMSMTIAALRCREPVVISGAGCVDKSYSNFYTDFARLGGVCHVV